MNKEFSAPIASPATSTSVAPWLRTAAVILGGNALLALCAHLALPLWFTPVPLTVQPFAVLLLGLLLTPRMAAATLCAYLAEGAMGLPVFAPAATIGLAHLLGPTGGYLMAYPIAALLISFLFARSARTFAMALVSAALGDLLILVGGSAWLAALTHTAAHTSAQSVLTLSLFPFLPGDAIKVAAAAALAFGLQRFRAKSSQSA
ncbi:MAG TPA: biotin transporter BioY [Terracidiphilus sp.]|nr:biotin transporter BioY [Terracidiphilus sp.]